MGSSRNLRADGERIGQLLDQLQASADRRSYQSVQELLSLLTGLYEAGISRMVELICERSPGLLDEIAEDGLVAGLLLIHGLHPMGLVDRLEAALAKVRPLLGAHGGDVELVDVDPGTGAVLIRLLGSCDGCPSSAVTLQSAVERAIVEAAPEITVIDVVEPAPPPPTAPTSLGSVPVSITAKRTFEQCPADALTSA